MIILASSSPQRKQLLENLGLMFDVIPSGVDESACPEQDPLERSKILARMKAEDVAKQHQDSYVIGCDTLVVASDGTLLEKPADATEARSMLEMQSGNVSTVHSAVCVVGSGNIAEDVSTSAVHFKELSSDEVQWWIDTSLWLGRSGSFQIDGPGQLMIEKIEGDFTGVVGLPLFLLRQLLLEVGVEILDGDV